MANKFRKVLLATKMVAPILDGRNQLVVVGVDQKDCCDADNAARGVSSWPSGAKWVWPRTIDRLRGQTGHVVFTARFVTSLLAEIHANNPAS